MGLPALSDKNQFESRKNINQSKETCVRCARKKRLNVFISSTHLFCSFQGSTYLHFAYAAPASWKSLPLSIRASSSLTIFRNNCKLQTHCNVKRSRICRQFLAQYKILSLFLLLLLLLLFILLYHSLYNNYIQVFRYSNLSSVISIIRTALQITIILYM